MLLAFSISSNILETVDSLNSFVTFILKGLVLFIVPLSTGEFSFTLIGADSPVSEDVSIWLEPSTTIPSRGIFSPGFTTITSEILTSSGFTF